MKENKRKIKGINKSAKRYLVKAGTITAVATMILTSSPEKTLNKAYAQEIEYDDNNFLKTDLEKYFTCNEPMNENYKVTTESDIYKVIEFYEKGTSPSNGYYMVEKDPKGLLVIGNGMTLKYQSEILEKLSNYGNSEEEILTNVTKAVNSGEKVLILEEEVKQATINEIQRCRDKAIEAANKYDINLSESQINIFTELNYRYGKGQSEILCKHLSNGGKLREFSISSNNDQPFNGIGIDSSIENLEKINLEDKISHTQPDAQEGDKRRFFMRQIGIEHDIFEICVDSKGNFKDIQTGEDIDIVEYLKQKEDVQNKAEIEEIEEIEGIEGIEKIEEIKQESIAENKITTDVVKVSKENKFLSWIKKIGVTFTGIFMAGTVKIGIDKKKEKEAKIR